MRAIPSSVTSPRRVDWSASRRRPPHVELADLDNDGWPDILTTASTGDGSRSVTSSATSGSRTACRRSSAPEDLGTPHDWITGPIADVDRDGRLDVLLIEIDPTRASPLLHNETASGDRPGGRSRSRAGGGIGARVLVYRQGGLGDPAELLGMRDIVASQGYTAGSPADAHFGLGSETSVDVRIRLADGRLIEREDVPANQHLVLPSGCR